MKPSFLRLMLKDMVDFSIVCLITFGLTMAVYFLSPRFTTIKLSFFFLEQFLELFLVNPSLIVWLFGLGVGVSIIYYLFSAMLFDNTIGGHLLRLRLLKKRSLKKISLFDSLLMAIGSCAGIFCLFLGPLTAWWFDKDYRGWSEKLAGTVFIKKI